MNLSDVVPWGRSLREYTEMFALTDEDMGKNILGCGDGPASFNAEMTRRGARVVSCDPIYQFSARAIRSRVVEIEPVVRAELIRTKAMYLWDDAGSPEELCQTRLTAMELFFEDYEGGREDGRYVTAELPELPFEDGAFDLAVLSHFLFLYSKHKELTFHLTSVSELLRVAKEVRIYPLVTLEGDLSPYVTPVMDHVRKSLGARAAIEPSQYRFQRAADGMLMLSAA